MALRREEAEQELAQDPPDGLCLCPFGLCPLPGEVVLWKNRLWRDQAVFTLPLGSA